jgi:hypothetical protein
VLDEGVIRIPGEVRDVLALAGDEIVDADHLIPIREQQIGQIRPEKPSGAGDENTHG